MKSLIKNNLSCLNNFLGSSIKQQQLLYHDVRLHQETQFLKQMEYVAKFSNNGSIHLTFDDGFASNFNIVKPILKNLGLRAIFFILSDTLLGVDSVKILKNVYNGNVKKISQAESFMSLKKVEGLLNDGHLIGSHTKSHKNLAMIDSLTELEDEIVGSANELERLLGVDIKHFAYPFGDISSLSVGALSIAKDRYDFIYSGIRGANKSVNNNIVFRQSVNLDDDFDYFKFIAKGGLNPYYLFDRCKIKAMQKK